MFLGLFRKNVKIVKVKRTNKPKKTVNKSKPLKIRVTKVTKVKSVKAKKAIQTKQRKAEIKKAIKPAATMLETVGKVTHYFPHVKAAVVSVTRDKISLGDILYIKGHTTDFKQKVTSIQIDNVPIKEAKPGQEIGLLVKSPVRQHDIVYKL